MVSYVIGKALALLSYRIVQFAGIAVVFIPLERLIPYHPKQRLFRRLFALDLFHYFVGGIFIIAFVRLTYFLMPNVSAWLGMASSPLSVRNLPWWGQVLIFEIGWTFLGYWLHRYEHVNPTLWKLHSIHESSQELDWLSAFRLHPLEPAMFQVVTIIPLWFFGMTLPVALGYKMYSYIFAHIQHANVDVRIGALKYIFPTPDFHRWHHARVIDEAGKKIRSFRNFGEYPFWDVLFGTFYMPDERPSAYGNAAYLPTDYFAQVAYPFGLHEKVLAIRARLERLFRVGAVLERARHAASPFMDSFEGSLASLSLTGRSTPVASSLVTMPLLGKEDA